MSKSTTKKSEAPQRNVRTDEELIADLEAKLAATRERAEKRANKGRDLLLEKRAKLVAQIEERQAKVQDIDAQLESMGAAVESDSTESEAPVV